MDRPLKLVIEALLFASDRPLSVREIKTWLSDETPSDINQAITELKAEYDATERSFALKEVAKGYQFRTKSEYGPYVLRMLKTSPTRLSRAALETLAIIAYKQPILRQEVERLRGVDAGGILRTLLEKNLIRILGRESIPGRPLIYGTTRKFLEVFDLKDLESLPNIKEIKAFGSEMEGTAAISEEQREADVSGEENVTGGETQPEVEAGETPPPPPEGS